MNKSYIIAIVVCAFFTYFIEADAQSIQIVTERGNVFVAEEIDIFETTEPVSMAAGFGVTNRLIYKEYGGTIISGSTYGTEHSLLPYNPIKQNTEFAAPITFDKEILEIPISEFYNDYRYVSGDLQQIKNPLQNTLGYSEQRTLWGDIAISQTSFEGIEITGTGRLILKLHEYDSWVNIQGTLSNGTLVRIVESPYDLITLEHDSQKGGYLINSCACDPEFAGDIDVIAGSIDDSVKTGYLEYDQQASVTVYHGKCCKGRYTITETQHQAIPSELLINRHTDGYMRVIGDASVPQTLEISDILRPGAKILQTNYNRVVNFDHKIYDTLPVKEFKSFPQNFFEGAVLFNSGAKYLVIDSPGGTSIIKGTDTRAEQNLIEVSGLKPHTVYRLGKDSQTLVTGITDENGFLKYDDRDDPLFSGIGGSLYLYENAPTWIKSQDGTGTIIFDNENSKVLVLPFSSDMPDDKMYNVSAYAKIPVIGNDVQITLVRLDDSVYLPYLNGSYSDGDSLFVPIIPTNKVIKMTINDTPVSVAIADIVGGGNIRIADTVTSTVDISKPSEFTHSISSVAGVTTFVIANTDGNIKSHIQATISGESSITNIRKFTQFPPPPPPPRPIDPLSTWIEVYINGVQQTVDGRAKTQIFFSDTPQEDHLYGSDKDASWHIARFSYPEVTVLDTISFPASSADFVEIYFYTKIYAEASIPPIPDGFEEYAKESSAFASATLKYASISVSM